MGFRLPDVTHRLTINGQNGSGKTRFGIDVLSRAAFDKIPYIVVDYKGDDLIAQIGRAKQIDIREKVPREPHLYIVHPMPGEELAMDRWLWRVWRNGSTGLFFDEGHMIPNSRSLTAYRSILTQGRSLHIPVITLTQRPVEVSRFAFSEANFYAMFRLNDTRDIETVTRFTPKDTGAHPAWNMETQLDPYHSRWYDGGADYSCVLKPCDPDDKILERIDSRLRPKRKWI